jgi:hypothetical protein
MALTDEDVEEIYAIINEALESNDLREQAKSARYVADKNRLEMEYQREREKIRKKARGRRPRGESVRESSEGNNG